MVDKNYDIAIIGGGIVGFSAAIYCARLNLKTLLINKESGGTLTKVDTIENYPGFKKIQGMELANKVIEHAKNSGKITIINGEVIKTSGLKRCFTIQTRKQKFTTRTILFCTGSKVKTLNVPGEKQFTNKGVHYCALCMPLGEEIVTNSNLKVIEEVNPTTRVLTMDGKYNEIGGFDSRDYKGRLISIRPRFFNEPVLLTPEHPVLYVNVIKGIGKNYWKDFKFTKKEWKPASEITTRDCVLYPILREEKDVDYIKISDYLNLSKVSTDKISPRKKTHTSKLIKDKITIDNDFLRLGGYYLSEGSASKHTLCFYFNKNERKYINDVKKIIKKKFNLKSKITHKGNVTAIIIYSRIITDLFKVLFNKYSYRKTIPNFIMTLPSKKQKELVKGYWRGDGCKREKDFCFVTVSKTLAYQLRDILLRLKIIPSIQLRRKNSLNKKINKIEEREISFTHDKYHITVGGQFLEEMANILDEKHSKIRKKSSISKHAWIKDGFAILPVREVNKVDYNGKVISLAVKNNHSYTSKGFIVHNCDGPLYKNKTLAIIGGGDSATKEALLLSRYAKKIYMISRSKLRGEPINLEKIKKDKKIEIIEDNLIKEIKGDKFVTSLTLNKKYKNKSTLNVDGIFIYVGHIPLSNTAKTLGVKLNKNKEIIIDKESKTNIQGIYAAGDVADSRFKQAITGVGEAVKAVYSAYEYLSKTKTLFRCAVEE